MLSTVSVTNGPAAGSGFNNHNTIELTGLAIAKIDFSITTPCSVSPGVDDGVGIDDLSWNQGATAMATDAPLPLWALGALGAGLIGIASKRPTGGHQRLNWCGGRI